MAAKIALLEQRAATIAGILVKTKDLSAMDPVTAERTRSFLEAAWKKFDAGNEKIYQSSREPTFEHPYFKEGRTFEDLFSSLVKDNQDISQVKKMHYLRSSLEGDAAKVISNLKLSADAFDAAWKRLVGKFDNKRLLTLAQIVNIVESSLSAIEALRCPVEHWGLIVLQRASSALDARTREDWEHHLGASTEIPPYHRLLSFISAAAQALEHIERHKAHEEQQTSPHTAPSQQTSPYPATTSQTSPSQSLPFIQDLSNNCCYCRRQHYLAFCLQFASLSRNDRVEGVMEARLSFNCLGRHNVRQCRSKRRCNFCGDQYHTLIHQEHRAISTKPQASQVRSKSSSPISNSTISSHRPPHLPARQKHLHPRLLTKSHIQHPRHLTNRNLILDHPPHLLTSHLDHRHLIVHPLVPPPKPKHHHIEVLDFANSKKKAQYYGINSLYARITVTERFALPTPLDYPVRNF
ncbi:hypothetical protein M0802_011185 [Mischocyttarus mexicanus]|nr:hypothetical protein M0802_011185 [Mischocyttarus mexicanus]